MAEASTAHEAIVREFVSERERPDYEARVRALAARNLLLSTLEREREEQGIAKKELAERTGLEASSVRRMLTAEMANPTTETAFRMLAVMGIGLEAILPSGERVAIVQAHGPAGEARRGELNEVLAGRLAGADGSSPGARAPARLSRCPDNGLPLIRSHDLDPGSKNVGDSRDGLQLGIHVGREEPAHARRRLTDRAGELGLRHARPLPQIVDAMGRVPGGLS